MRELLLKAFVDHAEGHISKHVANMCVYRAFVPTIHIITAMPLN